MFATTIRFSKELLEKIDKKAKEYGVTRSAYIKIVLTEAVNK